MAMFQREWYQKYSALEVLYTITFFSSSKHSNCMVYTQELHCYKIFCWLL